MFNFKKIMTSLLVIGVMVSSFNLSAKAISDYDTTSNNALIASNFEVTIDDVQEINEARVIELASVDPVEGVTVDASSLSALQAANVGDSIVIALIYNEVETKVSAHVVESKVTGVASVLNALLPSDETGVSIPISMAPVKNYVPVGSISTFNITGIKSDLTTAATDFIVTLTPDTNLEWSTLDIPAFTNTVLDAASGGPAEVTYSVWYKDSLTGTYIEIPGTYLANTAYPGLSIPNTAIDVQVRFGTVPAGFAQSDNIVANYTVVSGDVPESISTVRLTYRDLDGVLYVGVSTVAINGVKSPSIDKKVNKTLDSYNLVSRDEPFTWDIKTYFGSDTSTWDQARIVDSLDSALEVVSAKIVDVNGVEVAPSLGTLNISTDRKTVTYIAAKIAGSYSYLSDVTYELQIVSKIRSTVTDDTLVSYIKSETGGIPNDAQLYYAQAGTVLWSPTALVVPPMPVYVEPIITKKVNGVDHVDLANRDELFTYKIETNFGTGATQWSMVSVTDAINPLLDIKAIRVVDENGVDVKSKGTLSTDANNVITFVLKKSIGAYTYLNNKVYTIEVDASIKPTATDADLAVYVNGAGIPNKALLNFGDGSQKLETTVPTVMPPIDPEIPPIDPEIHKTINGLDHVDLVNREDVFTYNIETSFGNKVASLDKLSIVDAINPLLDVVDVRIIDSSSQDVEANGTLKIEKNGVVTFELNKQNNSFSYLTGQVYTVQIDAKVKTENTLEQLEPYINGNGIPNQAILNFGIANEALVSEIPTVTPPAVEPLIDKSVNKTQHVDLSFRDEVFTYSIDTSFGSEAGTWDKVSITDSVNSLLDIKDIRVTNADGVNVKASGILSVDKNNFITFELIKQSGSYAYLNAEVYTIEVDAMILGSASDKDLAPYIDKGGIPNQAVLHFGDGTQTLTTTEPTVKPPHVNPNIEKTVNNVYHVDLVNRDDVFTYRIITAFGTQATAWSHVEIVDAIEPVLDIADVRVLDSKGNDVKANGTLTVAANNTISFKLKMKNDSFSYLNGELYTIEVDAKVAANTTDNDLLPYVDTNGIPNQAVLHFGDGTQKLDSNIPTVTPPKNDVPIEPGAITQKISKSVNGVNHVDLKVKNERFTWFVNVTFGKVDSSWDVVYITDEVNPLLDILDIRIIDSNGVDVTGYGNLTVGADNIIKFELLKQDNSFMYLDNQVYTIEIDSKINDKATESELAPFMSALGIPNQAKLNFGDGTQQLVSELPTVKVTDVKTPGLPGTVLPRTGLPNASLFLSFTMIAGAFSVMLFRYRYNR